MPANSGSYFPGQRRHSRWRLRSKGIGKMSANNRIPLVNSPELQLRFLLPSDLPEIKRLCKEWFPIDYPDAWYNDITSNAKFYAVACVYQGKIIGLVVAEIKDYFKLPKEDSEILASTFRRGTQIGYILSLGVVKDYRKNGIASFLLNTLVAHLTSGDNCEVRAIYLHVLTTNCQAIKFYENRGFKPHLFLPYYYNIKGKRKDGFTYVRYINGGYQPWGAFDYIIHCCQMITLMNPCTFTRAFYRKVNNFTWYRAIPRLRQIAQSSAAVFS